MSGFKQVTKAQARRHISMDERIERVEGTPLELFERAEFVREIASLWTSAQEKFLLIGRYLVQARTRLPHGEFQAMVENELPFGYQVAYQLRMVTEAVDSGRLPGRLLPPSYATVYQLTTLDEKELEQARAADLIRPTVTRPEIVRFKRHLRLMNTPKVERRELLLKERRRLEDERDRILERLKAIESELADAGDG